MKYLKLYEKLNGIDIMNSYMYKDAKDFITNEINKLNGNVDKTDIEYAFIDLIDDGIIDIISVNKYLDFSVFHNVFLYRIEIKIEILKNISSYLYYRDDEFIDKLNYYKYYINSRLLNWTGIDIKHIVYPYYDTILICGLKSLNLDYIMCEFWKNKDTELNEELKYDKNDMKDLFIDLEHNGFDVRVDVHRVGYYYIQINKNNHRYFDVSEIKETMRFAESFAKSEMGLKVLHIYISGEDGGYYGSIEEIYDDCYIISFAVSFGK